ncbi:hypothetical protein MN116_007650 [Schistosoma mekongi]|uniref:Uncharacterized protein n=1 Tax=Schistosoma mekongi TaxID=38744 RepID=A0AAE2D284_SCHME|nr:hypothetical protein MN116_007650 [Schistosoma mekongi]
MPSVYYHYFLTSCLRFQPISWKSLNRHYGNSPSTLEHFAKIQELADRFPSDTCDRKVTLKGEIKRRVTECLSKPTQEIDTKFWEEEYQSLLRILKNYHRDNYRFPSGLSVGSNKPGGSAIAATGADLYECRRIIIERDVKQGSLLTRILSRFIM